MDDVYKQMNDDTEQVEAPQAESDIKKFYAGKTIFLTGSTGFIGICLVEKLLRGCSDIKTLYVLIRPKNRQSVAERMKAYFEDEYFDKVCAMYPGIEEKVVPIEGDITSRGLGLSPENRRLLVETVDIVIHNAASVYFTEKISESLKINVLGTNNMLQLCSECKHLQVFVYVSTAYSHCYNKTIEEKYLPPPGDLKMVDDIIRADTENAAGLTPEALAMLLGDYPNQYVFSKAIAEDLVHEYARRAPFPCGIFKPSVVMSTYKEAVSFWVNNLNGPVVPAVGYVMGIIHAWFVRDNEIDVVPADYVVNGLLAAVWDLGTDKKDSKVATYYNYCSSTLNPLKVKDAIRYLGDMKPPPAKKAYWAPFLYSSSCWYWFLILHVTLHFIPALFIDINRLLRGKKPMAVPLFFKFTKHLDKLDYFGNGRWLMYMPNTMSVWERLSETDRRNFNFDIRQLDWRDYFMNYYNGVRYHVLRDMDDTYDEALIRRQKLLRRHRIAVSMLALAAVYFVYRLISPILGG